MVADGGELEVAGVVGETAGGLHHERERLAVHAEVVEHLARDAVAVHVAQAGAGVVVAGQPEVGVVAQHLAHAGCGVAGGEVVELLEVPLRAVGPQLLVQERADVRVARGDDDVRAGVDRLDLRSWS